MLVGLMSSVSMVLPSRMMVTWSAIALISLSLWLMMIEVMPCALELADQVEQVRGVLVVQRRRRLVEDEQLDLLGQRLGDLDELLLADADVDDLGDRVVCRPTRASSFGARGWSRSSR